VKALDSDSGLNGEVRYSLGDEVSSDVIYVDERTGVLRLSRSLDRETEQQLKFTVYAADSTDEPKSASAEVNYACIFLKLCYTVRSAERSVLLLPTVWHGLR